MFALQSRSSLASSLSFDGGVAAISRAWSWTGVQFVLVSPLGLGWTRQSGMAVQSNPDLDLEPGRDLGGG